MQRSILFTLVAFFLSSARVNADTITLTATKDNTLYFSDTGALSNAKGQYFFAGLTNTGEQRRGLLRFNVAGSVPAGAIIQSATLSLTMSKTISGDSPVSLHRATADWGEGTSNAPGPEGAGAASTAGDATWLHRFFDTITWTTPGGDFDLVAVASTLVGAEGTYTWSSDAMTSLVQDWLDQPANNFGWVVLGDETTDASAKRFDSREFSNPSLVPQLSITFAAVPEPMVLSLVALGAAGALVGVWRSRRRRHRQFESVVAGVVSSFPANSE